MKAVLLLLLAAAAASAEARSVLRVGVWTLWQDREITVIPGPQTVLRPCSGCARLRPAPGPLRLRLASAGGRMRLALGPRQLAGLVIEGGARLEAHGEQLELGFPLELSADRDRVDAVATVPVESYVAMVVAAEGGSREAAESRQALAVAARSFALHVRHGHRGFDLCDSTHCQWLRWQTTAAARAAALATGGATLAHRGQAAEAYFSQNCGGRTASAAEVWLGREVPYLVSRADPYCRRGPSRGGEWSAVIPRRQLAGALAAAGLLAPGWQTLTVSRRSAGGRAEMLAFDGRALPAESVRLAAGRLLGWNLIRSNWFEVTAAGDELVFHGRGSGHGVGLCQAGAAEMAAEGKSRREILGYYFSGAYEADEASGRAWRQVPAAPDLRLETTAAADERYAPRLAAALLDAERRTGIAPARPIVVRSYATTASFRDATLAPGWTAAFSQDGLVSIQPLEVLEARGLLEATVLHELLHSLLEQRSAPDAPLWLREGLAELLSGGRGAPQAEMTLPELNRQLARPSGARQAAAAHRAAAWYAGQLVSRYGQRQTIGWLGAGLPGEIERGLVVAR